MGQNYSKADLKADTHSFSLGALFTFEASNARLTLNERKKSAHTGFSSPTPEIYCGESGQEGTEKRDTWGIISGSYHLTFGAQRTSCTLGTRRTTGPRETRGTGNSRSALSV